MNRTRVRKACALCTVRGEKISQGGREAKTLDTYRDKTMWISHLFPGPAKPDTEMRNAVGPIAQGAMDRNGFAPRFARNRNQGLNGRKAI